MTFPIIWKVNGASYTSSDLVTAYAAWQAATGQEKVAGSNVGSTIDPAFATGNSGTAAYKLATGSPVTGVGRDPTAVPYNQTLPPTDFFGSVVASPRNIGIDDALGGSTGSLTAGSAAGHGAGLAASAATKMSVGSAAGVGAASGSPASGSSLAPWAPLGPGTNYYVASNGLDSNPGTQLLPWLTIHQVNTFAYVPGSNITINFRAGDNFSDAELTTPPGLASCLFQGTPHSVAPALVNLGSSTVGVGAGTGGTLATITGSIVCGNNTSVKGLKVAVGATWYGIYAINVNNIEISYCDVIGVTFALVMSNPANNINVHHCTIDGGSPTSAAGTGIYFNFGSGFVTAKYNEIKNMGGTDPQIVDTGFGMHIGGVWDPAFGIGVGRPLIFSNGVPTNAVADVGFNWIHDTGGNLGPKAGGQGASGIEMGGDGGWIHDNLITYQRSVVGPFPGTDFDGIDYDIGSTNGLCERNLVIGCDGCGLLSFTSGNTPDWGPVTYRYNVCVNNGNNTFGNIGLQGFGNNAVQKWYNNTFVQIENRANRGFSSNNVFTTGLSNAFGCFANNITVTLIGETWCFIGDGTIPPTFPIENNCWFGVGQNFNCYGMTGSTYNSLAAIVQAIPSFDIGGHSIPSDPLFVGGNTGSLIGSDYALSDSSPCRGAGVDITVLLPGEDPGSTDFGGHSVRGGGAPHMGAFAFG